MEEKDVIEVEAAENKDKYRNLKEDIFDWIESIAISVFIVVIIFTFVFRIVQVKGESMQNTLYDGDRLITTNMFYNPKHGDVIVANSVGLNESIVKRVIGVAGDQISIDYDTNSVFVNGEKVEEDYIAEEMRRPTSSYYDIDFSSPVTVPEDCVFVMGDNRNHSTDGRCSIVGFVDEKQIVGKVIFRFIPFSSMGTVK